MEHIRNQWRIADYSDILGFQHHHHYIALAFCFRQTSIQTRRYRPSLIVFLKSNSSPTNFQLKYLTGLCIRSAFPTPASSRNPGLIESAIGSFLAYLKSRGEKRTPSHRSAATDNHLRELYNQSTLKTPSDDVRMENGLLLFISRTTESALSV